jgi:hypothetical protein
MAFPNRSTVNSITSTWAAQPLSSDYPLDTFLCITDIGEYGAVYHNTLSGWKPIGTIEIIQKGKGWIVPSLAPSDTSTYSQSGTLITVTASGHNIPATNYDTKDVYLDFGTPSTGAQLTSGWYSNFQRITLNTFSCVSAVSQTGTGIVKTNLAAITIPETISTIPGGVLGLNGCVFYSILSSHNNSVGTKNVIFNFDGQSIVYGNAFDEVREVNNAIISNRNNLSSQALADNGVPRVISVNTGNNVTCSFALQNLTEATYTAIHSCAIYISPS